MKSILSLHLFVLTMTGCGSPLLNEESPLQPPAVEAQTANSPTAEKPPDSSTQHSLLQEFGCPLKFEKVNLCARVQWLDKNQNVVDKPVRYRDRSSGQLSLRVIFWNAKTGQAENPKDIVAVKLWMPTHGHGSERPAVTLQSQGQYLAKPIYFSMRASADHPWQVKIQLKSKDENDDYDSANDVHIADQAIMEVSSLVDG